MFDTLQVAKRIRDARNAKNMTQMELADKMGVSFQAVSNWERGNSMPDISKLSDLSKVVGINISQILGGDTKEDETIEKVMENDEVNLSEIIDVAPLIPPKTIEKVVKEKTKSVKVDDLVALAPFLSSSVMSSMIKDLEFEDASSLVALAPFLDEEDLFSLLESCTKASVKDLVALAPFLSKDMVSKIALKVMKEGEEGSVSSLAPFMDEDDLEEIVMKALSSPSFSFKDIEGVMPHLDSPVVASVFSVLLEKGEKSTLLSLAPFMDEDDLSKVVGKGINCGLLSISDLVSFSPFLDSDELGEMVKEMIKK